VRPTQQTTRSAVEPPVAQVRFEDAVLVRQVQGGDLQAFAQLVEKYQDRVHNACLRICGDVEAARDLTQDAFVKALESIERFRGKSAFFTWIYRIAVNLALSHRRKDRTRNVLSLDAMRDGQDEGAPLVQFIADPAASDPSSEAALAETHDRVLAAIGTLDPEHRAALVLRDVEGLDYQQIADVLELPVGTVKSRIFRARSTLRDRLTGQVFEEPASDG